MLHGVSTRILSACLALPADLFGGADTWTEQGFEGEDQVRFQAVSMKLFGAESLLRGAGVA